MKLTQITSVILLCGLLGFGAACKRTEVPRPAPAESAETIVDTIPPAPTFPRATQPPREIARPKEAKISWRPQLERLGPPSLLVLQEVRGRCEWTVLRPPALDARLFLVTRACPSWFAWDRNGGRSAFTIEDTIYLHDWQDARVEAVASPGIGNPEVGFSTTGVLLACGYDQVPAGNDGSFTFRTTFEYQDGKWKKIGYENFGQEFFDFPCSNADDDEDSGEMRYNPRYQAPSLCPLEKAPSGPQCPSRAAIESVNARVPDPEGVLESMVYVRLAEQRFLAFRLSDLQVLTTQTPLFAVENDTVTEIYRRQPANDDIEVLFGIDHFLVTKWREMTHATLFEKGRVEPIKVFPDQARVMWIPGTIAPAKVIELTSKADDEK